MHIVLVHVHIKPEVVNEFIAATLDNVTNSLLEEGVVRFDFLQQVEDPTRFTLYEVYRTVGDQEKHRQSAHYLRWRDAVPEMMAETRFGVRYSNIHPLDTDW